MSWTSECCESNEFKVKNFKEVERVLEGMGFGVTFREKEETICFYSENEENGTWFNDDTEVILSLKPMEDGTNFVGVISDFIDADLETLLEDNELEEKDVMIKPITEYLQDQLLEGYGLVVTTAGFEGRCSGTFNPFGDVTFITKNTVKYISLWSFADKLKNELGVEI